MVLELLQNLFLNPCLLTLLLLTALYVYKTFFASKSGTRKNLPPSPRTLPIIGNLHQLGPSLHRSFQLLSRQYGKLMLLHLGNKPTLVVSCADAVREIMKTHDTIFSNRPESRIARRFSYGYKDVAFAPYGDYWRQMRSISVLHLLSKQRVQSFRDIREDEIASVIEKISRSHSSVVNLSEIILTFKIDVICRVAFGGKYNCSNNDGEINFHELLKEAVELLGAVCFGDFIPFLSFVDQFKGLNARVDKAAKLLDQFLDKVIREHQFRLRNDADAVCDGGKKVKTLVDILLEHQNTEALPVDTIKAVILNLFLAGTVTSYSLIEWTMSELIRHPIIMKELQEQVRRIGGQGSRIWEDDLEKLVYLKAVLMESLRLHHPSPLLIYREASQDVKVNGFDIGAGTQVIINAWAIQRDPAYWEEPDEFRPDRFLQNQNTVNFKGQDDFQYLPFGGGRRICPGISFAMVDAELFVANLVNAFDWKLPGGAEGGELDMAESVGMDIHKRDPLMVIGTPP